MSKTRIIAEPGSPQLQVARDFDAPRDLLYRAYTDPELLKQWLGPRRLKMTVDRFELRDGGRWRFVHSDASGEYGFRGVFHGTPSPEQGITQTWEWEGMPGHVSLQNATFEQHGNTTTVRSNVVYQSVEDRDAHIANGMEDGMNEGYARLEELLARLAPV